MDSEKRENTGKKGKKTDKEESRGPPPWNLVMPPSWEKYYARETKKILEEHGKDAGRWLLAWVKIIFVLFLIFIGFLILLSLVV